MILNTKKEQMLFEMCSQIRKRILELTFRVGKNGAHVGGIKRKRNCWS